MRSLPLVLLLPPFAALLTTAVGRPPAPPTLASLAIALGWIALQALLQIYAPGKRVTSDAGLAYTMNGWSSFWATWALLGLGVAFGLVRPTILYDELGALMTTANLFAFALAAWLHVRGRGRGVHAFFAGATLNPRVRGFDLKLFFEARPGLLGWAAIDLSCAAKQHALHGHVTTSMILVCLFQLFYVADYFFHEEAILTTWDIKHEKFGWMLAWGDLVWVPFTYSLQALYLVQHPFELPPLGALGLVVLYVSGYAIFRGANLQKHRFRKDPTRPIWGKPPETIPTARGTALLASGFWSLARHMNYLGDLMMGLAFCLTCGFVSPLPYFFIMYFVILLIHRERRDHAACAEKYGEAWALYCRRVPWRIVPFVY